MALFKCKMCGGTLEINHNETVATCEYCGTPQTLPKLNDEMRANLYDRANHFRRNNEFDKAMGIYEKILNEDHTDAEAYWSLVLCRYGIEYVEDPTSHKRIPTVNRAQFTSIFDDDNYKSALQYADGDQHELYEEEAKAINEIQKGILAISQKEEPFDVFICYKETDDTGRRTPDSVLANDLYHQLTQEGFKVFFARITLEDKLGSAYEPYIFAALNSAKVMVVLGTRPEFFRAVWVRNEWSRYLALIKQGQKKMLIPAYKDMDPYDLPEEFSHLQAQDMAKLGFMQDLVRGIKKIAQVDEPAPVAASAAPTATGNGNIAPLLKRAFMFLEDGDWHSANEYCEKVLDMDPENAQAYLGKLMAAFQRHKTEELKDLEQPVDQHNLYQKAYRYGDEALKTALAGYNAHINARNEAARLEAAYVQAKKDLHNANSENDVQKAAQAFRRLGDYKDAPEMIRRCGEKAEELRKEQIYARALSRMRDGEIADYKAAIEQLKTISGWKDSDDLIEKYQKQVREMEIDEKRKKRIIRIALSCMAVFVVAIVVWSTVLEPMNRYNNAVGMMEAGNPDEAYKIFCELGNFKDSADKAAEIRYNTAVEMMDAGNPDEAYKIFREIGNFKDSADKAAEILLPNIKVGSYIKFGTYDQDEETPGEELIEWQVLDIQNGRALIISTKEVESTRFHETEKSSVTWSSCSLRTWLNNDFWNAAFTSVEKARIPTVTVPADKNPEYDCYTGGETNDRIFLLSIIEAEKYFKSDAERKAGSSWWLRTSGPDWGSHEYIAYVEYDGEISTIGDKPYDWHHGVRPAMWINLNG